MNYTPKEILNFVEENDVKFIRLTFTDINGNLRNIAIMPAELPYAFEHGIPFDATTFAGCHSDLLLFPDISTLSVLPWRPKTGRVIRFFCNIKCTDGTIYKGDLRQELGGYIEALEEKGIVCQIGTKCEFYLFRTDEYGNPTRIPHDNASYLDIAPPDKCENVRREICLSLEEMGFNPQSSKHTHGPGQNEIDFKRSDVLTAADNMVYYKTVVKNIAAQNGLFASFMPKPLENKSGSGLHISITIKNNSKHLFSPTPEMQTEDGKHFIAGILNRIREITCFLNPIPNSYKRLGENFAPKYINWSFENHSQLIKIPYTAGKHPGIQIRSADASCNPYIVFKLLLAAGFEGLERKQPLAEKTFTGGNASDFSELPCSLEESVNIGKTSKFVREHLSEEVYNAFFKNMDYILKRCEKSDTIQEIEDEYFSYI